MKSYNSAMTIIITLLEKIEDKKFILDLKLAMDKEDHWWHLMNKSGRSKRETVKSIR